MRLPLFWKPPLQTAWKATEAEDKEKQEAITSRAAAKDISIDAKLFMSFLQLKKISTKEKMLCLQSRLDEATVGCSSRVAARAVRNFQPFSGLFICLNGLWLRLPDMLKSSI